ncbi:DUF6036 family nucleotidyltransferase [Geothrix sp. PMB-07]|uniref:DUF6036 family nucleotidyltransferase n=1 Tax=Geothrix sp. PMB-07 TaxID=3068640 RepID=UPI002741D9FF|nr:DUF6036 family nucleotidyltransferase [Geothrix sp. PMB-07]WLT30932.1 hypothetical protein Q9293_14540 [Geothrix sp. PMB-07]
MSPVEALFLDLDRAWKGPEGDRITLRVIGSVALMLQSDYARATKDGDVLEIAALSEEVQRRLQKLGGEGTPLAIRHRVYLDIVRSGIPFLPKPAIYHPADDLNAKLKYFYVEILDIVDVVVSKLKRFKANDVADIEAMASRGLVDPKRLLERFRLALDANSMSAMSDDYGRFVANFRQVQRDFLFVDETEFDLPDWAD